MKSPKFMALWSILVALLTSAFGFDGFKFSHKDWILACDNTGVCRLAGYQNDSQKYSLSVMFEREIGAKFKGFFKAYDPNLIDKDDKARLLIDGKNSGEIDFFTSGESEINESELNQILTALQSQKSVEFELNSVKFKLSNDGFNETFANMQDYQSKFDKPSQKPVIKAAKTLNEMQIIDEKHPKFSELYAKLKNLTSGEKCDLQNQISLFLLDESHSLLAASCDENSDKMLFLLMDSSLEKIKSNLGFEFNGFDTATLFVMKKQRHQGDCWEFKEMIWDGAWFKKSKQGSTGLCKGFYEGAWYMPTFISEIEVG